jgi:hypothetical protein
MLLQQTHITTRLVLSLNLSLDAPWWRMCLLPTGCKMSNDEHSHSLGRGLRPRPQRLSMNLWPNVVVNSEFIVDSLVRDARHWSIRHELMYSQALHWLPILYCPLIDSLSRAGFFSLTHPEKRISIHRSSPFSSSTTHLQLSTSSLIVTRLMTVK